MRRLEAPISRDVTRTGRRIIFILRGGREHGHEAFMEFLTLKWLWDRHEGKR